MKLTRLSFLALTAMALSLPATLADAQTVIRVQLGQNAGDSVYKFITETWMPKIEALTNGKVKFEPHPANSIVPSREVADSVADGVLQASLISPIFYTGKDPAFALIGDLIAGYDNPDQLAAWCAHGGGKELLQKAHDKYADGKLRVIGCAPYSREALVAKKPIRDFAALKGIKIRAPEGLAAEVFRRAGAAPVSIPFSEVYSALEKGVIDAADAAAYSNNASQGFNAIAPNPLFPGIHSMAIFEFTMNKKVWDGLGKNVQVALEVWHAAAYNELRRVADLEDLELVRRDSQPGSKVTVINWAQADRDAFRKVAAEAWQAFAAKSDLAKEVYASHMKFLKEIGLLQ